MSYQVLARKYRPKSFETLVGQEHVVRALSHALEQKRLHHAYLFTGTRGVGKTTLSRILAKSFNCETGITATPCGVCEACTAIDAGRFVDYIEMDAASNRGVDEMASLLEQAVYAPSNARFKVYMIDEVHMLTNHAFNAMLKTLEEPPEHVKFILATTDPQKIPVTVLSRCLQFNLKQMPPGHIVGHLENILGQEQISFDVTALRLLAQGAHGSMRDALSLTDQAIAYAAGKVTLEAVQGMLGALDQSYLIRLLDALAVQDGKALLDVADEMAARSLSYKSALQDLGSLLHQIAIAQLVPAAVAPELPEHAEVMRLSALFGKEEIQLFYQIAVHGRNELSLAPDEYAGFSMTLLRMLAFRPSDQSGGQQSGGGGGQLPNGGSQIPNRPLPKPMPGNAASRAAQRVQLESTSPVPASVSAPPSAAQVSATVTNAVIQNEVIPAAVAPASSPSSAAAVNSATSATTSAAAKPMSPAMAALAAARAASSKASGSAKSAPPPFSPLPVSTAVTAATPAPVPAPTVAFTARPQVHEPVAKPSSVSISASTFDAEPLGMDDMPPPPWDDEVALAPAVHVRAEIDVDPIEPQAHQGQAVLLEDEPQNILVEAIAAETAPAPATAVAPARENIPVPELSWDGHWPNLAASLPVRGVAQQLAQQSELVKCEINGNAAVFHLRVPIPTLLSSGSVDKLIAALSEKFNHSIRVETTIGTVEQTANAQAIAERAARQLAAEKSIHNDSFVQTLMREFGASIVTGSIKPI